MEPSAEYPIFLLHLFFLYLVFPYLALIDLVPFILNILTSLLNPLHVTTLPIILTVSLALCPVGWFLFNPCTLHGPQRKDRDGDKEESLKNKKKHL